MGRREETPAYFEARKALNQHLHRHHSGATGQGTLYKRLDQHEELHLRCKRAGISIGHTHGVLMSGESDVELANRFLREGEDQHGQSNIPEGSGSTSAVDPGERK